MKTTPIKKCGMIFSVAIFAMLAGASFAADVAEKDQAAVKSAEEIFIIDVVRVEATNSRRKPKAKIGTPDESGKVKWKKAKVGDVFSEGQILRTGFGTKVVLRFSGNDEKDVRGRTVVNPNTKVGFSVINRQGMNCQSQLRLKYGSINAEIDSTNGKKNDYRVRTPGGTLSARGTGGNIGYNADSGMAIHGKHGKWALVAPNGLRQSIMKGQRGNGKAELSKTLLADEISPKLGDVFGLTSDEKRQMEANPSAFPFAPGNTNQLGSTSNPSISYHVNREYNMSWSGSGNYLVTSSATTWSGSGQYYQSGIVSGSWSGSGTITNAPGGDMGRANLSGAGTAGSPAQPWTGTFHSNGGGMSPAPTGPGSTGSWSAQGSKFTGSFPPATPGTTTPTNTIVDSPSLNLTVTK